MIDARPYDGKVVVATHGAGFYTSYLTPYILGTNKKSAELYASVYPNPVSDVLNIEFVPLSNEITSIFIHNLAGQKVYDKKLKLSSQQRTNQSIPTNEFAKTGSGTFIVSIVNGEYKKSFKVIVRK